MEIFLGQGEPALPLENVDSYFHRKMSKVIIYY